ncbi:putative ancient ubiquitous protein 1 [Monocercomonoides exilis]|uniref:putative ancient ubiquitous protein 1 n=1 Tax=Monocercomonoides exilis TaxID=2049356 RepID=UPI003559C5D5|nr:putative ancient ubiquitous protein 1 [Monocercomonoides exilis]|eukprot:MONOS_12506.1-p1 / transcript=MONOS_12506.1 / gene=MONOS_12506 / organism=Monocercomonoides_exilis_PA203 / gene_product=unspecified product / transcript_product=unspecified product / location=Mono_scaffold00696:1154-3117(+) / protein_length=444 / sequence_SO=supercontig / SO=protein_coding / is_pseudo=false
MRRTDIVDPDAGKFCVEDIVDHTRFTRPRRTWPYFFFMLYIPFGLALLAIRLMFVVAAELFLFPLSRIIGFENAMYKFYRFMLGIFVTVKGKENWTGQPVIMISNHINDFDIVAVRGSFECAAITPLYYQTFLITKQMVKSIHPLYVSLSDRQYVRDQITKHLKTSNLPILCFAEGGLTSGKTCLLQYHRHLFSLGHRIYPMAISVNAPFDSVLHDHYLCATLTSDIFVMLFKPYHHYTISLLAPSSIKPTETPEEFAERVQKQTAQHLNLFASPFSIRDKAILVRKWMALRQGTRIFTLFPRKKDGKIVYEPRSPSDSAPAAQQTEPVISRGSASSEEKADDRAALSSKNVIERSEEKQAKDKTEENNMSRRDKRREQKDTLFLTRQARQMTPLDDLESIDVLMEGRNPRPDLLKPKETKTWAQRLNQKKSNEDNKKSKKTA